MRSGRRARRAAGRRNCSTAALSRSDTPLGLTEQDGRTQDLVGQRRAAEAGEEPRRLLHRIQRRPEDHAADAQRSIERLQFRRARQGARHISHAVPADADAERDLFGLPGSKIEEMFETRRAPYPVERTLIVSGMLESCLTSKVQGKRLETPHLNVRYQGPRDRQHA